MLTFDPTTTASLAQATSRIDWCERLIASLGQGTRKLVCKSAASGDPFPSGTTFIDCDLVGLMAHSLGKVRSFGATQNSRTALAADLTVGAKAARITNTDGSRWMQVSLALLKAAVTASFSKNPEAGDGVALLEAFEVAAPLNLSITGTDVPALDANTVHTVVLMNYENPGAPVEAGRIAFDDRQADIILEHPGMSKAYGAIGYWRCQNTITHGNFRFGAHKFRAAAKTSASNAPLDQVAIFAEPTNWPGYPALANYNHKTRSTYPRPFKILLLNPAGAQIGVVQMQDGKAINDKSLAQDEYYDPVTGTAANPPGSGPHFMQEDGLVTVRPHWNCGMSLLWQNARPALSEHQPTLYAGIDSHALRPSIAKTHFSTLGVTHLHNIFNANNYNDLYSVKQWPANYKGTPRSTPVDPYKPSPAYEDGPYGAGGIAWATGWGYEPGSISMHDWYSGPGGPRFDRAVIPSIYALAVSNPGGYRLEGNVPWLDMAHAYGMAYGNHSDHYNLDVRTAQGIGHSDNIATAWTHASAYYGGWTGSYPNPSSKAIELLGVGASGSKYTTKPMLDGNGNPVLDGNGNPRSEPDHPATLANRYDATGRHPWGFWLFESGLHGYKHPAWHAELFTSPMHLLLERFNYDAFWAGCLGSAGVGSQGDGSFLIRDHAWRWTNYVSAWVCAANHPLLYSQKTIEDRLLKEIEHWHDTVYVPAIVQNDPALKWKGLRNFGGIAQPTAYPGYATIQLQGGGLALYMSHCLQLWKVSGLWARMYNKSAKAGALLSFMIKCLDLRTVDYILDSNARNRNPYPEIGTHRKAAGAHESFVAADVADSWAHFNTVWPATGQASFSLNAAGEYVGEYDAAQHLNYQWTRVHKVFFSEFANPRLDAAIARYEQHYADHAAYIATLATPTAKKDKDWRYYHPAHGELLATVGYED